MATVRQNSREKILKAAAEVAKEVGPGNLSLDAVAHRAGVSKGGLLYNFPSKEKLLKAVVQSHIDEVDEQQRLAEETRQGASNPVALAYIDLFRREERENEPPPTGLLAAIAQDLSLIDPIKDSQQRLLARMRETSRDKEGALVAFLAVESLRWMKLCEFDLLDVAQRKGVIDRLTRMLADADGE